jgi:hypothetical protein
LNVGKLGKDCRHDSASQLRVFTILVDVWQAINDAVGTAEFGLWRTAFHRIIWESDLGRACNSR